MFHVLSLSSTNSYQKRPQGVSECVQLNIKRSTDNTRSVSSPMPSFIQLLLGVLSNLEGANTTFYVCLETFARAVHHF